MTTDIDSPTETPSPTPGRYDDGQIIERGDAPDIHSPFERPDPTEAPLPADDADKAEQNPTGN